MISHLNFFKKNLILLAPILLAVTFCSNRVEAESKHYRFAGFNEQQWGLGVLLGDPIGLRANYFTTWKRAFSFSAGYSSSQDIQVSADYLFYGYQAHDKVIDRNFWNSLIFYGGVGVLAGVGAGGNDPANGTQYGARLVGGLEYIFVGTPWSLRFEVAPEYFLKGKNTVGVAIGIGLTYYWWDGAESSSGATKVHETRSQAPTKVEEAEFEDSSAPPQPQQTVQKPVPKPVLKKIPVNQQPSQSELNEFK